MRFAREKTKARTGKTAVDRGRGSTRSARLLRRGGWVLWLYERSLGLAFALFFLASFGLHAYGGWLLENEQRLAHGMAAYDLWQFLASSEFWFQSFQNWQSEFLSVLAIVVLTIFLRQRGSPQSKPVAERHSETGA